MLKIIKENKIFFYPYFLILTICLFILLRYSKADIHIFINQYYSDFADNFFLIYTHLGDGTMIGVFILVSLFVKFRYSIVLAISNLTSTLLAQYLKRGPFDDLPRPKLFFQKFYEGVYNLRIVPDTNPGIWYPFPSGHTTTAFALFTFLAIIINPKYKYLKILCLIAASLVAYSRMYVSQHFLMDVTGGAVFGVFFTLLAFYFTDKLKYPWLDLSLTKILKNKQQK